jgi:RNA polymerase sigma-70 factor (ECF subfamily)
MQAREADSAASVAARFAELLGKGELKGAATVAIRGLGPEILGYLTAVVRDPVDASDLFSQFAESLWRSLPQFRQECSLRTWAYHLAWHAVQRSARDPYRRRGHRLATSQASRLAAEVRASTSIRREQRSERVERLRQRLEPDEQTLLILRLDRELSWREVAQVFAEQGSEIGEAALRKRFERTKDRLIRLARDEGLT